LEADRRENRHARAQRALELADRLRARLRAAGLDTLASAGPIVPVVLGENRRALAAAATIQARGFDVRAVRPPTVAPGTARLRLSVHADRTESEIDALAAAVVEACAAAAEKPLPVAAAAVEEARGELRSAWARTPRWARPSPAPRSPPPGGARPLGLLEADRERRAARADGSGGRDAETVAALLAGAAPGTIDILPETYLFDAPLSPHLAARLEGRGSIRRSSCATSRATALQRRGRWSSRASVVCWCRSTNTARCSPT
jgi:hypothetical protein